MEHDPLRTAVDAGRLAKDIERMATFTDPEQPGHTRRPFTLFYRQGRHWLQQEMEAAGLEVRLDAAGNLVGRRAGGEDLPPLMIGSHTDTVAGGGRFDGIIGVLGGLEVVRCLNELGIHLRHPFELVDFLGEEPTDFGVSAVGSRGMAGLLHDGLLAKQDPHGRTLRAALAELGGRPEEVALEARKPGAIAGYLELHIEQGPVLEQRGVPLAAVSGIAGIRRFQVFVEGQADHAGTTPMPLRRDALVAASRFVTEAEAVFCSEENAVGTVGHIDIRPNMANVVPGQAELTVEMRSIEPAIVERIGERLKELAGQIAHERDLSVTMKLLTDATPVRADPTLLALTTQACRETDRAAIVLPSGAGHDATQIATIAPIGMIFVPSHGGRSHCPEEWTDVQQVALGVQALLRALLKLDERV